MTDEKQKGTLDRLDDLTPEDWKRIQEKTEKDQNESDAWLKGLIDKHDKKTLDLD